MRHDHQDANGHNAGNEARHKHPPSGGPLLDGRPPARFRGCRTVIHQADLFDALWRSFAIAFRCENRGQISPGIQNAKQEGRPGTRAAFCRID